MKLIVISTPHFFDNEAHCINQLFLNGLQTLHIRKPQSTQHQIQQLIQNINPIYYPYIALHQHHNIHTNYNVKTLHYTEQTRQATTETEFKNLVNKGICISTSIHSIESYYKLPSYFNYAFFSSLFNSTSKINTTASINFDELQQIKKSNIKLIGLGGINDQNMTLLKPYPLDGFAVLGFVWNEVENCVSNYLKLQAICKP